MTEPYSYDKPDNPVAKLWIESIIRGRLSNMDNENIFCLGPPERRTKEIDGYEVCAEKCSVITHVRNEYVGFCDAHINILQDYLNSSNK